MLCIAACHKTTYCRLTRLNAGPVADSVFITIDPELDVSDPIATEAALLADAVLLAGDTVTAADFEGEAVFGTTLAGGFLADTRFAAKASNSFQKAAGNASPDTARLSSKNFLATSGPSGRLDSRNKSSTPAMTVVASSSCG